MAVVVSVKFFPYFVKASTFFLGYEISAKIFIISLVDEGSGLLSPNVFENFFRVRFSYTFAFS